MKPLVTLYLTMRDARKRWIPEASGVPSSLVEELARIVDRNPGLDGFQRAEEIVDEVVASLTTSGTIEDCVSRVKEYVASGCTLPILCIENANTAVIFLSSTAFSESFNEPCESL